MSEQCQADINLRNKGRGINGRLYRGCVKDAFTKLSIGSIPSNYESIIYHHEERQGFGTSQKRFYAPQTRMQLQKNQSPEIQSPSNNASHSVKGYGSLIAKQKRSWMKLPASPGPGRYQLPEKNLTKFSKKQRKCVTRQQIRIRKQEVAGPGPGDYNVEIYEGGKLKGWKSSFETRVQRQNYIPKSITPGPGVYDQKTEGEKEGQKNRDKQEQEWFGKIVKERGVKVKAVTFNKPKFQVPGPGAYDTQFPSFKPLYEKIKISSNFIDGDRFNNAGKQNEPSPGSYDVKGTFNGDQKLINWPCFMSQSRRCVFGESEGRMGPNLHFDGEGPRRIFHFNIRGDWL